MHALCARRARRPSSVTTRSGRPRLASHARVAHRTAASQSSPTGRRREEHRERRSPDERRQTAAAACQGGAEREPVEQAKGERQREHPVACGPARRSEGADDDGRCGDQRGRGRPAVRSISAGATAGDDRQRLPGARGRDERTASRARRSAAAGRRATADGRPQSTSERRPRATNCDMTSPARWDRR